VFKELSDPGQVVVFLDISTFGRDRVDVDNTAHAVYQAVARYYGASDLKPVPGITLSFIESPETVSKAVVSGPATDLFSAKAEGWAVSKQPAPPAQKGMVSYPENTLHNRHSGTLTTTNSGAFKASRCYLGGKEENGFCQGVQSGARIEGGKCTCDVYVGKRARSKTEFRSGFDEWKAQMPKPSAPPTFTKDNLVVTYYDVTDGDAYCKGLEPSDCNDISKCSAKCNQRGCGYGSTVSCWEAFYYDTMMQGTAYYKGSYYSYKTGIQKGGKLGNPKSLFFEPKMSIAVNPNVGQAGYIPWGSRVYIDFKADDEWDGWYLAEDTGGAFRCCPKIDIFAGRRGQGHPSTGKGYDIWVYPPIDTTGAQATAVATG
jgi:3D (Asp-Asp-Asp) domain-containing protein